MSELTRFEIYMLLNQPKPLWLAGINLSNADLRGANLAGANLQGANLSEADLEGADLTDANLKYAGLVDTSFEYCKMDGADLSGADLTGAIICPNQFDKINLERTIMPDGDVYDHDTREYYASLA